MKILIVILILILLGLQLRLWAGTGSAADVARLKKMVAAQAIENAQLKAINEALYKEVDELKTGLDAIEERARDELGLIKEGETFYLIVDAEDEDEDEEGEDEEKENSQ